MIAVTFGEVSMFGLVMAMAVAPLHFDCNGPVAPRMPASAILAKFGREARRQILPGAAGTSTKAVVLYPDDPARRIVIAFWDDAQTAVASVTAGAKATAWTGPLGLHAGSSLEAVVAANGSDFALSGFGWDYGGYLTHAWGGKLTPRGGCAVQIRFGLPGRPPKAVAGELDLNSTLPAVRAAAPRVEQLSVGWPLPAGVRASN
jgi:hypothetical protein